MCNARKHNFLCFLLRGKLQCWLQMLVSNFNPGQTQFLCSWSNVQTTTPFAVYYDKIGSHLRERVTNSAQIHSLTRKTEHLHINDIQLRFLHFNQHSLTFWDIRMCHSAHKRERLYTFIKANIQVIYTILKVCRDIRQPLKCKHYSLTFLFHCLQFNSIPGRPYDG